MFLCRSMGTVYLDTMPRLQPSTLFPYTTLFRSAKPGDPVYFETIFPVMVDGHVVIPAGSYVSGEITEDRKSTRLNSSHMSISYAVFCLKKKIRYLAIP